MNTSAALTSLRLFIAKGVDPRDVRSLEIRARVIKDSNRQIAAVKRCCMHHVPQTEIWKTLDSDLKKDLLKRLQDDTAGQDQQTSEHDAVEFMRRSRARLEAARKLLQGFKAGNDLITDTQSRK